VPEITTTAYVSPIGALLVEGNTDYITQISFIDTDRSDTDHAFAELPVYPVIKECINQLEAYFTGRLKMFDVPIAPAGTDFQKEIWRLLQKLPYGQSATYTQLSDMYGNPSAIRAVAAANGSNPIMIIVPCHRVIGAGYKLTGYAGGLHRKEWLLRHEGVYPFAQIQTLDI